MQYRIATTDEWAATRTKVSVGNLASFDAGEMRVTEKGVTVLPPGSALPEIVTRDLPGTATREATTSAPTPAPNRAEPPAPAPEKKTAVQLFNELDGEVLAEEIDTRDFWGTKERDVDLGKARANAKTDREAEKAAELRSSAFYDAWNKL